MDDADVFAWRDAYLVSHPDVRETMETAFAWSRWYSWHQRQQHPVRIIEQRYRDGQVIERDVTPDDPEPPIPWLQDL